MIGKPLDRSKNPVVALGTHLADITGVVEYAYVNLNFVRESAPSFTYGCDAQVRHVLCYARHDSRHYRAS